MKHLLLLAMVVLVSHAPRAQATPEVDQLMEKIKPILQGAD